ncbi:MAG: DUF2167 domain-containing protein [Hyphomonadaceae bacterium]
MRKIILAAVLAAAPAALSEIVFARQAIAQEPPAPTASGPDAAGASDLGGLSEEELEAAFEAYKQQFDASLTRRTGHVDLPVGFAALEVPDGYYYLDPQDAKRVLEEAWDNPPTDTLSQGMLFPAAYSPLDDGSWGVLVEYEETGYVSDDDAAGIDYDALIGQIRKDQKRINKAREKQGYEPIEIVRWASPPHYDGASHKLYWAKELKFGEEELHTLNYEMRILGRSGVLSMNFIAAIDDLDRIETASPAVLRMAAFEPGKRYEDFDPKIDKKAGFGVAGLIAGGGAAALLAKKAGLFSIALLLLKKGWVVIVALFAGAGGVIQRFFGKKTS